MARKVSEKTEKRAWGYCTNLLRKRAPEIRVELREVRLITQRIKHNQAFLEQLPSRLLDRVERAALVARPVLNAHMQPHIYRRVHSGIEVCDEVERRTEVFPEGAVRRDRIREIRPDEAHRHARHDGHEPVGREDVDVVVWLAVRGGDR